MFSVTIRLESGKNYYVICSKNRKFENPEILYIFKKALALSIIYSRCNNEDEKIYKEE